MSDRVALLVVHTARRKIVQLAEYVTGRLTELGFAVRTLPGEDIAGAAQVADEGQAAAGAEIVLTLGGDGTFLRAAEIARPAGVPMLGVNLGHVGFLAYTEPAGVDEAIAAIAHRAYAVEERVTVDADVIVDGAVVERTWALNEVSLERTNRERMLEISVTVDCRPLLRFGCDGLLCATPTGSTAYAFSAGGPIIWPDVDALLIVPNAAHALFARPIIVAPTSVVEIDLVSDVHEAVLSSDGRRSIGVSAGARIRAQRGTLPVKVVRIGDGCFTDRLVDKFQLPVQSLREASAPPADDD